MVSRPYLYALMKTLHIPQKTIERTKRLLEDNTAGLNMNSSEVGTLKMLLGLGQGDQISCTAYNLTIVPVTLALNKAKELIKI